MILGVFIVIFCLTAASHVRDEENTHFSNKRSRRNNEIDEGIILNGMQLINLSEPVTPATPAIPDFISSDAVLRFCYEKIPQMTKREITSMFDEAIYNENFGLVKVVALKGDFDGMVDSDQIEALCRSRSEVSANILDFILDKTTFSEEFIETNLGIWLINCVPFGFNKFKSFWKDFKGENLPIDTLAGILTKTASYETRHFFDFVLEKVCSDAEKFDIVMKKAVINCTLYINSEKIGFLLENGLSLSSLDVDQKIIIVVMATNTNNLFLLKLLLRDREVLLHVRIMARSPWVTAVHRDHPEILDAYIKAIPDISCAGLCMSAFRHESSKILEYFKSKGVLTADILFRAALTAIQSKKLALIQYLNNFGIPAEMRTFDGWSLLTVAVDQDAHEIVEFLIKTCGMNPNEDNVFYDTYNRRTTFRAIYYAKSPAMVHLLASNGANVNDRYDIITHHGVIIRSTTALHKAASESNIKLFQALLEHGADIKIPDTNGLTNEAFYYRNLFNHTENFQ